MPLRVKIDPDICQGHGLCFFWAEGLYEISESDGRATVLLDPVPPELHDAARKSALICPERAITIVEDEP